MKAYNDFLSEAMSAKNFNNLKKLNKTVDDRKKGGALVKAGSSSIVPANKSSSAIVPTGNQRTTKEPVGKSVSDQAARNKMSAGYMSKPDGPTSYRTFSSKNNSPEESGGNQNNKSNAKIKKNLNLLRKKALNSVKSLKGRPASVDSVPTSETSTQFRRGGG